MAQNQPFQPGYSWYQGSPLHPSEETPRVYETLPSETDPTYLTNSPYAPSFGDTTLPRMPTGFTAEIGNRYSGTDSGIQDTNLFRNTVVSSDGYGPENEPSEQRIEKVKYPCFTCKWKKKKCSEHKPCDRCLRVRANNHHDQFESESESWIPCFHLALDRCNGFQLDLLSGSNLHSQTPSHNSFQRSPDLRWTIGTPLMALGRAPSDTAPLNFTNPAFLDLFRPPHFTSEFLDDYTFLVNPNVTKLLQVQYESWPTIAERRGSCGISVLQCLMTGIKRIMRMKDSVDGEAVFPLFLAAVGTFLAVNDTRGLPHLQSPETLEQLKFELGVCIVVFGLKWDFLTPLVGRGERDLLEDICSCTNDRVVSFICPERLY